MVLFLVIISLYEGSLQKIYVILITVLETYKNVYLFLFIAMIFGNALFLYHFRPSLNNTTSKILEILLKGLSYILIYMGTSILELFGLIFLLSFVHNFMKSKLLKLIR